MRPYKPETLEYIYLKHRQRMTTKTTQQIITEGVAEFDKRWPLIETELGDDHPAFIPREVRDWLTTTLTQLVKEVEAGERERIKQIILKASRTTEPEWIAKDIIEEIDHSELDQDTNCPNCDVHDYCSVHLPDNK